MPLPSETSCAYSPCAGVPWRRLNTSRESCIAARSNTMLVLQENRIQSEHIAVSILRAGVGVPPDLEPPQHSMVPTMRRPKDDVNPVGACVPLQPEHVVAHAIHLEPVVAPFRGAAFPPEKFQERACQPLLWFTRRPLGFHRQGGTVGRRSWRVAQASPRSETTTSTLMLMVPST